MADDCSGLWHVNDKCLYVQQRCLDDDRTSYLLLRMTCSDWLPLGMLELIFIFVLFGRSATEYLSPNLAAISHFLKLPQSIAGVTFAALGNCSPDLFSTVAAIQAGSLQMALAEVFGAANFIICIVVGCIAMLNPCVISKWPFIRDVIASITISLIVLLFLIIGQITFIGCLALFIYYILYVVIVVIFIPSLPKRSVSEDEILVDSNQEIQIDEETEPFLQHGPTLEIDISCRSMEIVSEEVISPLKDGVDRITNIFFPIIDLWKYANIFEKLYLLIGMPGDFIFGLTVPVVIHSSTETDPKVTSLWVSFLHLTTFPWVIFLIFPNYWIVLSLTVIGFSLFIILRALKVSTNVLMACIGFVCSCTWISILSNELVALLQAFGILFSISESFLGCTVFAFGNSLLDFLTNIKIAQLVSI